MPQRRAPTALEIRGYRQATVACVLHSSGDEGEVAVIFPGAVRNRGSIGGSPARPDLHYTGRLLAGHGLAVLEVWWDFGTAPEDDLDSWLDEHLTGALAEASRDRDVALLAGRSLGTRALARAVTRSTWRERQVPTIWVAPLLNQPPVFRALTRLHSPAFVVGGSNDPMFAVDRVEAVRKAGHLVHVVDGADHSPDADDAATSARLLADVLDHMRTFIARLRS